MSVVNAFDWERYTEEEHARRGDPFADIKRNAAISVKTTRGVQKLREKNPSHGTIHGITDKSISYKQPDMMRKQNAKTKK